MGTPWFKMKDLARQHGIRAFSSNYTLYGDMSNRATTVLRDFAPDLEVYSIDVNAPKTCCVSFSK